MILLFGKLIGDVQWNIQRDENRLDKSV
jgi:hypothetical protein